MKTGKLIMVWTLVALALRTGWGAEEIWRQLKPRGSVSDFAGVFLTNDSLALEHFLAEVERQTGAQIAVVTLDSLAGGEIADTANRLFEQWGIGRGGQDNGVLLLAALRDHKARIEVGYGLEGDLNDARVGRILDEAVIPYFRQNNYRAGLQAGAQALARVILEKHGLALTNVPGLALSAAAPAASGLSWPALVFVVLFFSFIIFLIVIGKVGRGGGTSRGGRSGTGGFSGSGSGGGSSSSSSSFGGGHSGGGGASRGW